MKRKVLLVGFLLIILLQAFGVENETDNGNTFAFRFRLENGNLESKDYAVVVEVNGDIVSSGLSKKKWSELRVSYPAEVRFMVFQGYHHVRTISFQLPEKMNQKEFEFVISEATKKEIENTVSIVIPTEHGYLQVNKKYLTFW